MAKHDLTPEQQKAVDAIAAHISGSDGFVVSVNRTKSGNQQPLCVCYGKLTNKMFFNAALALKTAIDDLEKTEPCQCPECTGQNHTIH